MRQNNRKLYGLAQGAMIAAIYVALTMVFAPISFGPVQFRIAEALYCRSLRRQLCPDYSQDACFPTCSAGPCRWTWYSEAWPR